MTLPTIATQLRKARVTNLIAEYVIEMTVTDRGELPDKAVFLMEVVDPADPKNDTLARVCSVADLETFELTRVNALRAGQGFFRTQTVTKFYPKVNDAVTAKDFLIEQVNALCVEYITYITEFKADPAEVLHFPMVNAGVLGPALSAYTTKAAETDAQTALVAEKQASCAELTAQYNAALASFQTTSATLDAVLLANQIVQDLTSTAAPLAASLSNLSAEIVGTIQVWAGAYIQLPPQPLLDDMDNFLENPTGRLYTAFHNEFSPARVVYDSGVQTALAQLSVLTGAISAQTTAVATQQAAVDSLFAAKESCALEVAQAQQVLGALVQERTRLLGVVRDLCPTFTP